MFNYSVLAEELRHIKISQVEQDLIQLKFYLFIFKYIFKYTICSSISKFCLSKGWKKTQIQLRGAA